MNKAAMVDKVCELSGVDRESCEKVLKAAEKVLQDELGSGGLGGMMGKAMSLMQLLGSKKGGE